MGMTDPPAVGPRVDEAWRAHRPYLVNLAYQMLGDIGDAEDVAQEAFLRFTRTDIDAIEDVRAWLTVVTGRLSLDLVRSARSRYELSSETSLLETKPAPLSDPAERVTLDDQVSAALLEVLQRLSPGERVSLVLHDVFKVPFDEIAETVGRPVGTCRQLARRGRAKIQGAGSPLTDVDRDEHAALVQRFISACATGDLTGLTVLLDPAVWGAASFLCEPAPPPQVNHGPDAVATNLLRFLGEGPTLVGAPVGQPVLLGFTQRRLFAVLTLTVKDARILKIEATVDPTTYFTANSPDQAR
jgi:RNA polymerase sigma-70 factor, ECF subfamily